MTTINQITDVFAILGPNLQVTPKPFGPTFYPELQSRFDGFANHVLVSAHDFTEDWPTWERHPKGDEIVLLLSGRATLLLRQARGDVTLTLNTPGTYIIVPANTWHTARVDTPTRMLFITPGEGTENRILNEATTL